MPDDYFTITRAPAVDGAAPDRVLLAGDLDMGARDELRDTLVAAAGETTGPRLVVDLRQVRFIDSEAISAILEGYLAAERAGLDFRLTGALGIVRRVFDVIGLDHLFLE
ncbi:STAS domain-containing protein [Actinoplanes sp. DH11]|uniref:STAS domain-containing protein n=1 Tax=Actinoplanes sp. DH11 TaxID=2857011 RepID=UPI001E62CC78|nr:STAS domain-containing protein [Actinoplanes sp. DH11]